MGHCSVDIIYTEEKQLLLTEGNGRYDYLDTACIQDVSKVDTQVRIDKERKDEYKGVKPKNAAPPRSSRFTPPTLEEVQEYVAERHSSVDPQAFIDFYASKGWMVGKSPMKDWKAACRNAEKWERWDKNPQRQFSYDYGDLGGSL